MFSRLFFMTACLGASLIMLFSYVIIPAPYNNFALVLLATYALLMIEHTIRDFTQAQYRTRYTITVVMEAAVTAAALFTMDAEYILFVPVILGTMFIGVNTILQSRVIGITTWLFLATPIVKVLIFGPFNKLYAALSLLFILSAAVSEIVFRNHVQRTVEVEKRADALITAFAMTNQLTTHNVRNVSQRIQGLALPKYLNNPELFAEKLNHYLCEIDRLVNTRLFESHNAVDVRNVFNLLSASFGDADISSDIDSYPITCNEHALYGCLKNLIDNSREAAARLKRKAVIHVTKQFNVMILVDNCGGFDTSKIKSGHSSKPSDKDPARHGVFLRTVTDPSFHHIYGFNVELEQITGGTKITITFNA
jgi:hypothetical protein